MRSIGGRWSSGGLPHPPAMGLLSSFSESLTSPSCLASFLQTVCCSEHLLALRIPLCSSDFPPRRCGQDFQSGLQGRGAAWKSDSCINALLLSASFPVLPVCSVRSASHPKVLPGLSGRAGRAGDFVAGSKHLLAFHALPVCLASHLHSAVTTFGAGGEDEEFLPSELRAFFSTPHSARLFGFPPMRCGQDFPGGWGGRGVAWSGGIISRSRICVCACVLRGGAVHVHHAFPGPAGVPPSGVFAFGLLAFGPLAFGLLAFGHLAFGLPCTPPVGGFCLLGRRRRQLSTVFFACE